MNGNITAGSWAGFNEGPGPEDGHADTIGVVVDFTPCGRVVVLVPSGDPDGIRVLPPELITETGITRRDVHDHLGDCMPHAEIETLFHPAVGAARVQAVKERSQ